MPKSRKFRSILKAVRKKYGVKKGTRIAYAIARKRQWRT